MTRLEKCIKAKEMGYRYDPETGIIFGKLGREIKAKHSDGYLIITNCNNLLAHHFAWYSVYDEVVEFIDHINRVRDDNRIANLRSVSNQKNCFNRSNKGYYWASHAKKWKSQITINYKTIHLGYYNTEKEAHNAYLLAKQKYHIIN